MTKMPRILFAGLLSTSMLTTVAYAADVPAGTNLAADQTYTYRLADEFTSADPQIVEDTMGSEIVRDLFEGLFNQDNKGNLVPGVALSVDSNDSKDVYTFHLRDNAKWSNGDPVTAHDFVYAWRRLVDPATASPYQWFGSIMNLKNVEAIMAGEMATDQLGVTALDDHTLEARLEGPLPYFALTTTHASTFPSHQATVEAHGTDWTKPENIVSNGAYVLSEHIPGERVVRVRNANYWDNDKTVIEKVVGLVINDDNVALTRYFAGELDKTEIPAGQYPKMKAEHPDEAHSFPRLCNFYWIFNLSGNESANPAFQDVRVREALSLATDRKVITDSVLQGGQFQAYTYTPSLVAGFEAPDVPIASMTQAERDAKAKELMAEAGYGPDNPLSFSLFYNTNAGNEKLAVATAAMWKQKLGAEVELLNQEWKTFLEARSSQGFELARGAWCGDYNEASTFLDLLQSGSGYNDGKFSNARVDELLAAAKTADDTQPLYTEVEQIIAEEVPVIPVYHYTRVMMLSDGLKGWPFDNVEQNNYSKDYYKVAE